VDLQSFLGNQHALLLGHRATDHPLRTSCMMVLLHISVLLPAQEPES
jgi:hypothetical protein